MRRRGPDTVPGSTDLRDRLLLDDVGRFDDRDPLHAAARLHARPDHRLGRDIVVRDIIIVGGDGLVDQQWRHRTVPCTVTGRLNWFVWQAVVSDVMRIRRVHVDAKVADLAQRDGDHDDVRHRPCAASRASRSRRA